MAPETLTPDEKNRLSEAHIPLVRKLTHRLTRKLPPHIDRGELLSAGLYGLADAVSRFNPSLHSNFAAYASFRIKGAIIDCMRRDDTLTRSLRGHIGKLSAAREVLQAKLQREPTIDEIAEELGISLNRLSSILSRLDQAEILALDDIAGFESEEIDYEEASVETWSSRPSAVVNFEGHDPLSLLLDVENSHLIGKALSRLDEKEKRCVILSFYENLTLKEIGELLGVTESRASQLRTKGLRKIKRYLLLNH